MATIFDLEHVMAALRQEMEILRERFDVEQLSVFGSISRGESRPDSDLDLLVKFKTPEDFDRYMDLKFHLERLLGVRVDLVSDDAVRKEIRPFVDREAIRVS
jgi:predicted nucleotidyltransferase